MVIYKELASYMTLHRHRKLKSNYYHLYCQELIQMT